MAPWPGAAPRHAGVAAHGRAAALIGDLHHHFHGPRADGWRRHRHARAR